jgi:hypothetical protein
MAQRNAHAIAAYWALALVGLHLGLQWPKVAAFLKAGRLRPLIPWGRFPLLALAAYGLYACFERGLWGKLFLGHSFDFWDPDKSVLVLMARYLAIIVFWAFLAILAKAGVRLALKAS